MTDKIKCEIARAVAVMRRQHKSLSTERDYAGWLRRYFEFRVSRTFPPETTREKKVEAFLTSLARDRQVAAATQNVAFNAICFFYRDVLQKPLANVDALRATRPTRVRHAPSVLETFALLNDVKDVGGYSTNLVARMLYGCGLRVSEPLNLRTKDISFDDGKLFVMGGKGRKDRVVSLPDSLVLELRGQLDYARAVWRRDVDAGVPVEMPEALARKYPEYRSAWGWAWVFPGHQPCRHPRTGEWVRWRMHEVNVQRAIRDARRRLGIMVLPHELRHAYATHCLDRGVNIKALKDAMGHAQVETTMGYCHADALSVRSPLEQPPSPVRGPMLAVVARGAEGGSRMSEIGTGPPLCEPLTESLCEPIRFNSSKVTAFSKGSTKLLTAELLTGFGERRPEVGVQRSDELRSMVREALALVGEKTAREFGGWYWNRARENKSKFERVLAAVRSDVKEGMITSNTGGHFWDTWRRFAD